VRVGLVRSPHISEMVKTTTNLLKQEVFKIIQLKKNQYKSELK